MTPAAVIVWIVCTLTAWAIGRRKGYPYWGLAWGILLAPVGVIAMALWPRTQARKVADARKRLAVEDEARKTK